MSGVWFVVRSRDEWAGQVRQALGDIAAANGGVDPVTLRDAYDVEPAAFGRMIEGLVALGVPVGADMLALAGMRDVGDFL